MERQEATGRFSEDMSATPWGVFQEDMTPSYGLVSRTTEALREAGGGVSGISVLFLLEPKDGRAGRPTEHTEANSSTGFFPQADALPIVFPLRQAFNSVLTTGHQRKRP